MGQTIAEKIMSRHNLTGQPAGVGDLIDVRLDGLMYHNNGLGSFALLDVFKRLGYPDGPPTVFDPDRVFLMNEHHQPARSLDAERADYESRKLAQRLNISNFYGSELGICHQMMMDYGHALPGELIVGNDSHTIAYGAVTTAATGIGSTEAAYAWVTGELFFTVPQTIRVTLNGAPRPYPFGKDIILYLAGRYGDSFALGHALEFDGTLADAMDMTTRLTIADHGVEVGAMFAFFQTDDTTREYLRARTSGIIEPVKPDPDAHYLQEVEINCDELGFQVARPFRFDNVCPVGEVLGVRIDQAKIGSCANGRFEDIEIAARMLKGRKVARDVKFQVSPASMAVYKQCVEAGVIGVLIDAGAQVLSPGCTICQHTYVLNEQTCITATTRNYRGRFGGTTCADAQLYLAGPATVAAAAIAGEIVDPREFLDV